MDGFRTTRGPNSASFYETVKNGAAPNAEGLYMPASYSSLFFRDKILPFLEAKQQLGSAQIATFILRNFIPRGDIQDDALRQMMETALNFEMPLEVVDADTFILRLDRGPTASFKDVAARTIAGLMEKYCEAEGTNLNLIVATSGDTGVAVADAFGNKKNITVTVMYPHGGVSRVQENQMLDVAKRFSNVRVLAIAGTFDDAQNVSKILQNVRGVNALSEKEKMSAVQSIIAEIKMKLGNVTHTNAVDAAYVEELGNVLDPLHLSSANSINIWRLIPQMTQYFTAYQHMVSRGVVRAGEEVVFSVPSGNVGHLTAGLFARKMGLPVKRFIVGTNANNILANMIGDGVIHLGGFEHTSAPSMDIEEPSNFERLLYLFRDEVGEASPIAFAQMANDIKTLSSGIRKIKTTLEVAEREGNSQKIDEARAKLFELLKEKKPLTNYGDAAMMEKIVDAMQKLLWVEDVETDEELHGAMRYVAQTGVVMEPHGVAAMIATWRARRKSIIGPREKVIVLETAHPDKFPDALAKAGLQDTPHMPHPELARLKDAEAGEQKAVPIDLMEIARSIRTLAAQHC